MAEVIEFAQSIHHRISVTAETFRQGRIQPYCAIAEIVSSGQGEELLERYSQRYSEQLTDDQELALNSPRLLNIAMAYHNLQQRARRFLPEIRTVAGIMSPFILAGLAFTANSDTRATFCGKPYSNYDNTPEGKAPVKGSLADFVKDSRTGPRR